MRVYVGQYDDFWSLSAQEWIELCKKGIETEYYDLSDYKKLKSKPTVILSWRDEDGVDYVAKDEVTLFFQPLDWCTEDFEDGLREVEERLRENRQIRAQKRRSASSVE